MNDQGKKTLEGENKCMKTTKHKHTSKKQQDIHPRESKNITIVHESKSNHH